ncbi:ribbon-helix-helix protein, CopG family [Oceanibaculum pacificum]|uniref:ribbon-helix-helix protein, CopG family n=1 Tax=Oceanibaculum pacificum TaxID=580166 RepID=UPI000A032D10
MPRPRGTRKTARISVSLDAEDYAVLTEIARREDVSVAWVVRRAVGEVVRAHQSGAAEPELPLSGRSASTKGTGTQ